MIFTREVAWTLLALILVMLGAFLLITSILEMIYSGPNGGRIAALGFGVALLGVALSIAAA